MPRAGISVLAAASLLIADNVGTGILALPGNTAALGSRTASAWACATAYSTKNAKCYQGGNKWYHGAHVREACIGMLQLITGLITGLVIGTVTVYPGKLYSG